MSIKMVMNENVIYSNDGSIDQYIVNTSLKLEANKAGSLEFTVLPGHPYYDDFCILKTVIFVYEDDDVIFRGRVLTVSSDFYKQKTVTCEGDVSFLLDSQMEPYKGTESLNAFFSRVIANHNSQMGNNTFKKFTVGNVTIPDKTTEKDFDISSYSDSNSTIESEIIDEYGGLLITRYENDTVYIDLLADPFQDISSFTLNNQDIEFGVNLLDIEAEPPIDDIFTILLPIGKDKDVNIESVSQDNSKFLPHSQAVEKYGRIIRCEQWSEITDPQELLTKATEFLNTHASIYPDNLTIKAVDLHLFDPSHKKSFRLYDKIRCYSDPHGLDGVVLICLSVEYDFQNPENNSYMIGSYVPSDSYKGSTKSKTVSSSRKVSSLSSKTANNSSGTNKNGKKIESVEDKTALSEEAIDSVNARVLERRTNTETIQVSFNPSSGNIVDLTPLFEAQS